MSYYYSLSSFRHFGAMIHDLVISGLSYCRHNVICCSITILNSISSAFLRFMKLIILGSNILTDEAYIMILGYSTGLYYCRF